MTVYGVGQFLPQLIFLESREAEHTAETFLPEIPKWDVQLLSRLQERLLGAQCYEIGTEGARRAGDFMPVYRISVHADPDRIARHTDASADE